MASLAPGPLDRPWNSLKLTFLVFEILFESFSIISSRLMTFLMVALGIDSFLGRNAITLSRASKRFLVSVWRSGEKTTVGFLLGIFSKMTFSPLIPFRTA